MNLESWVSLDGFALVLWLCGSWQAPAAGSSVCDRDWCYKVALVAGSRTGQPHLNREGGFSVLWGLLPALSISHWFPPQRILPFKTFSVSLVQAGVLHTSVPPMLSPFLFISFHPPLPSFFTFLPSFAFFPPPSSAHLFFPLCEESSYHCQTWNSSYVIRAMAPFIKGYGSYA